jgi:hypothetical protein
LHGGNPSGRTADVKFKLATRAGHSSLNLTFNPSQVLAGLDRQPTLEGRKTGNEISYPSSSHEVTNKLFELGFDLFHFFQGRKADKDRLEPKTDSERIRIHRIQWDAFLLSSNPHRFLQLLPLLYGQSVSSDRGVRSVAGPVGLECKFTTGSQTNEVMAVTLEKLHGRKKLFAVKFSISGRAESEKYASKEIRLGITAYTDGIDMLVRAARKRLTKLIESDPKRFEPSKGAFEAEDVDRSGHQVAAALWVLAHCESEGGTVRYSFAKWLVPFVLSDVLRLNIIGGFTRDGLQHIVELEDEVAAAWREKFETLGGSWASALAKECNVTNETVYKRRREWLRAHAIDISIPYQVYADLLSLGSLSAAEWKRRAGIVRAVSRDHAREVLARVVEAIGDFDEQRLRLIGKQIASRLRKVDVVAIGNPLTMTGAPRGRQALLSPSTGHRHPRSTSGAQVALQSHGSSDRVDDDVANRGRAAEGARRAAKSTQVALKLARRKRPASKPTDRNAYR